MEGLVAMLHIENLGTDSYLFLKRLDIAYLV